MPQEPAIPIDLLYWLLAFTPLATLLILLVVFRWKAAQAGPVGYLVAAVIALLFFRTPIQTLAIGTAKGFWDAVFILYIVWTALALYEVAKAGNVFESFRVGVRQFTPNRLVQFLAFGLVFVLFLQATAGFGTPIAVVAPLLIGLGIRPLYAVSLALIGHVWGNSFGALAISWLAMNLVVPVTEPTTTLVLAGLLLTLSIVASALTLTYAFGGRSALREGWLLIVVLVIIYGLGQLLIV
ncbi:MAG: L-lactate permease, partial [Anaerolineae bacterium]|nr:L-lactate permease [Anaerolineae bacterium]